MFDYLTKGKSRYDLEQANEEMRELIKEAKETIVDLRDEKRVLEHKYNESYSGARRFAKVISDTLTDEEQDKAFKELEEQEKLFERWSIMGPD